MKKKNKKNIRDKRQMDTETLRLKIQNAVQRHICIRQHDMQISHAVAHQII